MSLTHAHIKAAADGIKFAAHVSVRPYTNPWKSGPDCVAAFCSDAQDVLSFGMSLAQQFATKPEGGVGWEDSVDAIQYAIEDMPLARLNISDGHLILFWPAVEVDPEVAQ